MLMKICYCKRDGLPTHRASCRWAGRPVKDDTAPRTTSRSSERDDASEKMERRHDRLEGGGWEESR